MYISKRQLDYRRINDCWLEDIYDPFNWSMHNYDVEWSIAHQCFIDEDSTREDVTGFWHYLKTGEILMYD